ncbi:hypothetical protein [Actinomadura alba]|uniref:Uncharacterized protein n=1 Tax=Actinomadura alba TaxID=406431 RepID=A0ABR7LLX5_9ACTN|nr:hypothetical protein [Actinomadura alba]MBC6465857.1 hypothetical protein [Actinomadura alba]
MPVGIPGMDHHELAQTIRRFPGRYHGRVPDRTLARITAAAAAGQWEKAVNKLITALSACAEPITTDEYQELRTILTALHMPGHRAAALRLQRGETGRRSPTSSVGWGGRRESEDEA